MIAIDIDDASLATTDEGVHESFDRQWAQAIIEAALSQLETSMKAKGREVQFKHLQPWLDGGSPGDLEQTAKVLSMSANALKVSIHRTRKRFRKLVRAEVAATLPSNDQVGEEIDYLIRVLAKPSTPERSNENSM